MEWSDLLKISQEYEINCFVATICYQYFIIKYAFSTFVSVNVKVIKEQFEVTLIYNFRHLLVYINILFVFTENFEENTAVKRIQINATN